MLSMRTTQPEIFEAAMSGVSYNSDHSVGYQLWLDMDGEVYLKKIDPSNQKISRHPLINGLTGETLGLKFLTLDLNRFSIVEVNHKVVVWPRLVAGAVDFPMPDASWSKSELKQLLKNIQAFNGNSYTNNHDKGVHGEIFVAAVMHLNGYDRMETKLNGNQGFDGVWVKRDKTGQVIDVVINETKYRTKGKASLGYIIKDGDRHYQGSPEWIQDVRERMDGSNDLAVQATAQFLNDHKELIRWHAACVRPNGKVSFKEANNFQRIIYNDHRDRTLRENKEIVRMHNFEREQQQQDDQHQQPSPPPSPSNSLKGGGGSGPANAPKVPNDAQRTYAATSCLADAKSCQQDVNTDNLENSYGRSHPNYKPMNGESRGSDSQTKGVEVDGGEILNFASLCKERAYEYIFVLPSYSELLSRHGHLFSIGELRQIIFELTRGIYLFDAVPFFSLHFNEEGNQYPVVHPVYKNTLVGKIILTLDYFMKSFIHGGKFKNDTAWKQLQKEGQKANLDLQEDVQRVKNLEEELSKIEHEWTGLMNASTEEAKTAKARLDAIEETVQPIVRELQQVVEQRNQAVDRANREIANLRQRCEAKQEAIRGLERRMEPYKQGGRYVANNNNVVVFLQRIMRERNELIDELNGLVRQQENFTQPVKRLEDRMKSLQQRGLNLTNEDGVLKRKFNHLLQSNQAEQQRFQRMDTEKKQEYFTWKKQLITLLQKAERIPLTTLKNQYSYIHFKDVDVTFKSIDQIKLEKSRELGVDIHAFKISKEKAQVGINARDEIEFDTREMRYEASVRMHGKQNSIQHYENMFILDPDHYIEHSWDALPSFVNEMREYYLQHNKVHPAPEALEEIMTKMDQKIKEEMAHFDPEIAKYIELLKVMNFMVYFLRSLKRNGQMPIPEIPEKVENYSMPDTLPPLPVDLEGRGIYRPVGGCGMNTQNKHAIRVPEYADLYEQIKFDYVEDLVDEPYLSPANGNKVDELGFYALENNQFAFGMKVVDFKNQDEVASWLIEDPLRGLNNRTLTQPQHEFFKAIAEDKNPDLKILKSREANALFSFKDAQGWSIAHWAVANQQLLTLQKILAARMSLYIQDIKGMTPLHLAITNNFTEVTYLILHHAMDVRLLISTRNKQGFLPLHLAAQTGNKKIVQWLLNHGADRQQRSKNGLTPLMIAIQNRRDSTIKLLMHNLTDILAERYNGETVLHHLAAYGKTDLIKNALRIMQQSFGADSMKARALLTGHRINKKPFVGNRQDETPMHVAAQHGHIDALEALLKNLTEHVPGHPLANAQGEIQLDMNHPTGFGTTPFITALNHSELSTAEFLMNQGAEFSMNDGGRAIHHAILRNDIDTLKFLANKGYNFADSIDEKTPFETACIHARPAVIELFMQLGFMPNITHLDLVLKSDEDLKTKALSVYSLLKNIHWNVSSNHELVEFFKRLMSFKEELIPLNENRTFTTQTIAGLLEDEGVEESKSEVSGFSQFTSLFKNTFGIKTKTSNATSQEITTQPNKEKSPISEYKTARYAEHENELNAFIAGAMLHKSPSLVNQFESIENILTRAQFEVFNFSIQDIFSIFNVENLSKSNLAKEAIDPTFKALRLLNDIERMDVNDYKFVRQQFKQWFKNGDWSSISQFALQREFFFDATRTFKGNSKMDAVDHAKANIKNLHEMLIKDASDDSILETFLDDTHAVISTNETIDSNILMQLSLKGKSNWIQLLSMFGLQLPKGTITTDQWDALHQHLVTSHYNPMDVYNALLVNNISPLSHSMGFNPLERVVGAGLSQLLQSKIGIFLKQNHMINNVENLYKIAINSQSYDTVRWVIRNYGSSALTEDNFKDIIDIANKKNLISILELLNRQYALKFTRGNEVASAIQLHSEALVSHFLEKSHSQLNENISIEGQSLRAYEYAFLNKQNLIGQKILENQLGGHKPALVELTTNQNYEPRLKKLLDLNFISDKQQQQLFQMYVSVEKSTLSQLIKDHPEKINSILENLDLDPLAQFEGKNALLRAFESRNLGLIDRIFNYYSFSSEQLIDTFQEIKRLGGSTEIQGLLKNRILQMSPTSQDTELHRMIRGGVSKQRFDFLLGQMNSRDYRFFLQSNNQNITPVQLALDNKRELAASLAHYLKSVRSTFENKSPITRLFNKKRSDVDLNEYNQVNNAYKSLKHHYEL
ncbi:MAG: ankyrin repeat domain-containing protein [Pseudomonadota bacterium]